MTDRREAIVLPAIFLTVTLLGGFRVTETIRLVPPSLTALILAVLLIGTIVRGGALALYGLLHGTRSGMENVSGAIVLLTMFAASSQVVNLLLPDRGLLHAAFAILIFCQLLTIGAARTDRAGTLRSLLVLLGSLFVLRYLVIEALYAADRGLLNRVLTAMMSGATLGGIAYEPNAPITGYVAFFTLILYFVGLLLLPSPQTAMMVRRSSEGSALTKTLAIVLLFVTAGCGASESKDPAAGEPRADQKSGERLVSATQRDAALRSAQVWIPPATQSVNLESNPAGPGSFGESDTVECRLVVKAMGGTTPKFDCELPDGDVIRVKYGRGNPELHAEAAATRLLVALGFGADRMYFVKEVRCAGCTSFPFHSLRCLAETGLERVCFPRGLDYAKSVTFDFAIVERRLPGRRIESTPDQGWAWFELDRIDPAAGGTPKAHGDALKLMAVFLAHWDNKAENQRLICLPGGDLPDGGCSRPLAMLQDLGASFGPAKLDLHNWRAYPIWADARTCRVSMDELPWGGATFREQQISDEGRRFLLNRLEQLSPDQVEGLFRGARIESSEGVTAEGRQPRAWAAAFQDKVRQIREAGPCPSR